MQQLRFLLGLPEHTINVWTSRLFLVTRSFAVAGSLSPGLGSTTGCPEGDPRSVLAMIAIYAFVCSVEHVAQPRCHADNWSWISDLPETRSPAMGATAEFVSFFKMEFDWDKSYSWSTKRETRTWWKRTSPSFLPSSASLAVVTQVKELGTHMSLGRKEKCGLNTA